MRREHVDSSQLDVANKWHVHAFQSLCKPNRQCTGQKYSSKCVWMFYTVPSKARCCNCCRINAREYNEVRRKTTNTGTLNGCENQFANVEARSFPTTYCMHFSTEPNRAELLLSKNHQLRAWLD